MICLHFFFLNIMHPNEIFSNNTHIMMKYLIVTFPFILICWSKKSIGVDLAMKLIESFCMLWNVANLERKSNNINHMINPTMVLILTWLKLYGCPLRLESVSKWLFIKVGPTRIWKLHKNLSRELNPMIMQHYTWGSTNKLRLS